jgi:hypothetical protein
VQQAADEPGRTLWILADGVSKKVSVTVGPSDGKRTQILAGDIALGQDVIVDSETGK